MSLLLRPWRRLLAELELGYRISPGVEGLTVHQAPVSLFAGWEASAPRLAGGLYATGALKVARAGGRGATGIGVEAGGWVQASAPLQGAACSLTVRASIGLALLRQRYPLDSGVTTEQPWSAGVATGVVWP